jgi:hypothetical protein
MTDNNTPAADISPASAPVAEVAAPAFTVEAETDASEASVHDVDALPQGTQISSGAGGSTTIVVPAHASTTGEAVTVSGTGFVAALARAWAAIKVEFKAIEADIAAI